MRRSRAACVGGDDGAEAARRREGQGVVAEVLVGDSTRLRTRLGWAPTVDFADLIDRLRRYVAYTPLNNIAGTPAISPASATR